MNKLLPILWAATFLTSVDIVALIGCMVAGAIGKHIDTDYTFGLAGLAFVGCMGVVGLYMEIK